MLEYIGDDNAMLLIEAMGKLSEAIGSLRRSDQRESVRQALRRIQAVLKALQEPEKPPVQN